MKFYSDLYCTNDSMHGCTKVTLVDRYERPIFCGTMDELDMDYERPVFCGTMDELDMDYVGNMTNPIKNIIAYWASCYATVWEYHIVSVSTTAPDDACAVSLTNGIYISELYVKVNNIDKLNELLHANGIGIKKFLSYVGWNRNE